MRDYKDEISEGFTLEELVEMFNSIIEETKAGLSCIADSLKQIKERTGDIMYDFEFESYDQYVTFLKTFLVKNADASIIVDNEIGNEIMAYLIDADYDIEDYIEEGDGVYLISKLDEKVIIEYPFNDDGELLGIEVNKIIVHTSVLTEDEINQIECEELHVIDDIEEDEDYECSKCDCESCKAEDEYEDMLEEYALLLEDTAVCPDCIRNVLREFADDLFENFKVLEIEQ